MKKFLLTSALFFLLFSINNARAQDKPSIVTIQNSTSIHFSKNDHTITLCNASISTEKLTVMDAEKIVMETGVNKIEIYAPCKFKFTGRVIVKEKTNDSITKLEYIAGEDVIYFK